MVASTLTDTAIRLVAASIYHQRDAGRSSHSFIIQQPGQFFSVSGLGIEINYEESTFIEAVLFVRRHGAPYLASLSFSDVRSLITSFISDTFFLISSEVWGSQHTGSFRDALSDTAIESWGAALKQSFLFVEPRELTLFPLSVVECGREFVFKNFFLVPPDGLTPEVLCSTAKLDELAQNSFPPFARSEIPAKPVTSWLGVWAPNVETATRLRATILGAIALLPHSMERYSFSHRTLVAGRCTLIGSRYSVSIGDPHTPALAENVILGEGDEAWLRALSEMLTNPAKEHRRKMRALEYQYRAWTPGPARRFPSLIGAIDAVFGDGGKATQAVVNAVRPIMGEAYDATRVRVLLSLRASVIHGGAPNVYESTSYRRYYENYHEDAVRDLEVIVARCLQSEVFNGAAQERPHTYADLIEAHSGRKV